MIYYSKAPGIKDSLQIGPWPVLGRGTGKGGRIPARWVAGGEGKEAREVKWARANLLMGSG